MNTKHTSLLYGKSSLRQIPVLRWLVLSRSGFCSTARFHVKLPEEAKKMIFFRNLTFKLARMKGRVGFNLLSIAMRTIDFEAILFQLCPVLNRSLSQLHLTLTRSIFCNQENIVWSTRNPFSSFRINSCFVRFRYKAFLKLRFTIRKCHTIRNSMPLHFAIRNRVPYNKQLTNRAWSGRTGEYWSSAVAVRISLRSVRIATTANQYSIVRPSLWVSKHLIFWRCLYITNDSSFFDVMRNSSCLWPSILESWMSYTLFRLNRILFQCSLISDITMSATLNK